MSVFLGIFGAFMAFVALASLGDQPPPGATATLLCVQTAVICWAMAWMGVRIDRISRWGP